MKLVTLEDKHRPAWDAFVDQHASVFHLSSWINVVESSYRFRPHFLFWEQDGSIAGVLPGFFVKRPFVGKAYISSPFAVSAGPVGLPNSEIPMDAIEQKLTQYEVDYIEFRDTLIDQPQWLSRPGFSNFEKRLGNDHDDNFLAIPNRQRAVIRKAEKENLVLDVHDDVHRFLKVYEVSLRNLGTPIYAQSYFHALKQVFTNKVLIASVRRGKEDLSSVLCFVHKDKLMPYYGGGTANARHYHAFPWMYWQLMRLGVEKGYMTFDFGRSPTDSGAYQFKKNLGFQARTMPYAYLAINKDAPDLSQSSELVTKLTSVWKRMPIRLARQLGPIGSIYAV